MQSSHSLEKESGILQRMGKLMFFPILKINSIEDWQNHVYFYFTTSSIANSENPGKISWKWVDWFFQSSDSE